MERTAELKRPDASGLFRRRRKHGDRDPKLAEGDRRARGKVRTLYTGYFVFGFLP